GQGGGVVADVEEEMVAIGTADRREQARRWAETLPGLRQRRPFGVPQERVRMLGILLECGNPAGENQAAAAVRARTAFVRMASVHDHGGIFERAVEEFLVVLDLDA